MSETQRFLGWWLRDEERAKCTLQQAIGAYIQTYPGRIAPLLVELVGRYQEENT